MLGWDMSQGDPSQGSPIHADFVGDSPAAFRLKHAAIEAAPRSTPILILGERGSGKETLARFIHQKSRRAGAPFIPVDCSALPDDVFARELFGRMKGVAGGACDSLGAIRCANGGTLFLDALDQLTPELQNKLIEAFRSRTVVPVGGFVPQPINVRVISAASCALDEIDIRRDLLSYLGQIVLQMPALRDRSEDILPLSRYLLTSQARVFSEKPKRLSGDVQSALQRYDWPGNVRELAAVMSEAHMIASGGSVEMADLPYHFQNE
jgi:two-component system response regulator PilR (NtrC family)